MKYLDPQFTDHLNTPDAMKLEFILAGKEPVSQQVVVSVIIVLN